MGRGMGDVGGGIGKCVGLWVKDVKRGMGKV